MRRLFLLGFLGGLGWFAWSSWAPPDLSPVNLMSAIPFPRTWTTVRNAESKASIAPGNQLPFSFEVRTKRLIDEYKRYLVDRRVTYIPRATRRYMRSEVAELYKDLQSHGLHDTASLQVWMKQAAVNIGYEPNQAEFLIQGILSL